MIQCNLFNKSENFIIMSMLNNTIIAKFIYDEYQNIKLFYKYNK